MFYFLKHVKYLNHLHFKNNFMDFPHLLIRLNFHLNCHYQNYHLVNIYVISNKDCNFYYQI